MGVCVGTGSADYTRDESELHGNASTAAIDDALRGPALVSMELSALTFSSRKIMPSQTNGGTPVVGDRDPQNCGG